MSQSVGRTLTRQPACDEPTEASVEPYLFRLLQCDRLATPPARYALSGLASVAIGRGALFAERSGRTGAGQLTLAVPDPWMSSLHAHLRSDNGRFSIEDANSRNGTLLNGSPVDRAPLSDGDLLELGNTFFIYRELSSERTVPDLELARSDPGRVGLTTLLPELAEHLEALERIARSNVSVTIYGESGTGKELAAQALHALSARTGAFVAVNCGALPAPLVESELFGYRKGAFSGATESRPGLVRAADRGTLFLDEIGDLPLASQAAFLRVLQERQVQPVGDPQPVAVDLRICVATHRDLPALVADGQFRHDLLMRLGGFSLHLPPLRARREDLGLLIVAILRRLAPERRLNVGFSAEATRALVRHDWPGNVRELQKCLEAALVLAGTGVVELRHLPGNIRRGPTEPERRSSRDRSTVPLKPVDETDDLAPEERQRRAEIASLLEAHRGNVSAVARTMGKAQVQIRRWLKRYRIDADRYRRR